jgi:hypothetical protein
LELSSWAKRQNNAKCMTIPTTFSPIIMFKTKIWLPYIQTLYMQVIIKTLVLVSVKRQSNAREFFWHKEQFNDFLLSQIILKNKQSQEKKIQKPFIHFCRRNTNHFRERELQQRQFIGKIWHLIFQIVRYLNAYSFQARDSLVKCSKPISTWQRKKFIFKI